MARMLDDAIAADNRILDAATTAGAVTGVHLCRGNSMGRWMAEGGYDWIASFLQSVAIKLGLSLWRSGEPLHC
jgi:hypothetical protein